MNVASAVIWQVPAQGVQILSPTLGQALDRALNCRKYIQKFWSCLDRRVDECFRFQVEATGLLQKAKREPRDNFQRFLLVNPPTREPQWDGQFRRIVPWHVRKINRRREDGWLDLRFLLNAFHAQRE